MKEKGNVLILGATSDIGRATARAFAKCGHNILLAARDVKNIDADAVDLELRYGIEVTVCEFNALDTNSFANKFRDMNPQPSITICFVGMLGEQSQAQSDNEMADLIMRTNYNGPVQILGIIANAYEKKALGMIVGVSSVAGDRGRASNYIYGSAKAGFTTFLSGLRNRLNDKNVRVLTVKLGFAQTKMTEGMILPAFITAQPEEIADAIVKACAKDRDVIYVRPIWRIIMVIIKFLPEFIFKRTKL